MQCPVHRGVGVDCPLCAPGPLDGAHAALYRLRGWEGLVDSGAYTPPDKTEFLQEHNHGTPWLYEPDEMHWRDGDYGCATRRGGMNGVNGYVQVPEGHVWDLRANSAVAGHVRDTDGDSICTNGYDAIDCDVHGGLTFWGELPDLTGEWFGFDTGHGGDMCVKIYPDSPDLTTVMSRSFMGPYRTFEYVRSQIEGLVRQATLAEKQKLKRKT